MNAPGFLLAGALDWTLGDPRWLPHPVRGFGRVIEAVRSRSPRRGTSARLAGAGLAIALPAGAWAGTAWGLSLARRAGPLPATLLSVYLVHTSLAYRELADGVLRVHRALTEEGPGAARRTLSGLVGRSTERLNRREICRAAMETAAEGFLDGWLSPLFWLLVGGVPAMVAYKAVNTLDSMVGYRDAEHADFGWASARLDDLANALPARLCPALVVAAGFVPDPLRALRRAWRDRGAHPSPNAGHPEAAFAAVLNRRLGGPVRYGSRREIRPRLHPGGRPPGPEDLPRAVRLLGSVCLLSAGITLVGLWVGAPLGSRG